MILEETLTTFGGFFFWRKFYFLDAFITTGFKVAFSRKEALT
jgi:hypothetical protein